MARLRYIRSNIYSFGVTIERPL